ncbi:hypothetical protein JD844_017838 [Phrynosoma platyrhinos]|uniref:Uncharacterized protein n=1 Tax=Phrynosoma platyrhinos TaxID=52577 RepID=A0ABQ7SME5_PHRPL|nr:hypothetical protein JD844_017838 [Phrynosoma platyrhinos]
MVGCAVSNRTPAQTPVSTGIGMLPFFPSQHVVGQAMPRQNSTQDKLPPAMGLTEGTGSGSQTYLQNLTNATFGGLRAGHLMQQSQPKSTDSNLGDSLQQWYQQYAQVYHTIQARVGELENDGSEESDGGLYGDYSTYLQVMPSYYATAQGSFPPGILPLTPQNPLKVRGVKIMYILFFESYIAHELAFQH